MYNFEKLNEADYNDIINGFRNMLAELTQYISRKELNEVIDNSMMMEPDFYRNYGLDEIADAIEEVRAEG